VTTAVEQMSFAAGNGELLEGEESILDTARRTNSVAEKVAPVRAGMSTRRKVVLMLVVAVALIVAGMAQVWVRLRIVKIGYELSRQTTQTARLSRVYQKLSVEQALLRSPERIKQIAAKRLGLRPPRPEEVHEINRAAPLFGVDARQ